MGSGEPKDPKRFIRYAKWAVAIVFLMWAMMQCGVYVGAPGGTPADMDWTPDPNKKSAQKTRREHENRVVPGPQRHDQREDPALRIPDAGAYDDPRYEGP